MLLGKPLLNALDRMGYGGILLDAQAQVLSINTVATKLLRENASRNGSQSCSDWRQALKSLLHSDKTARFTMEENAWVVIRRDSEGKRPLVLHAVPIAEGATSGPHTVVILIDLVGTPQPTADALQKIFGLSPAEAKLAVRISQGESLADVAEASKVSITTARSQLASIFAKTRTRRQAELVSLLTRISILP